MTAEEDEISRAGLPLLHPDDTHAERTAKLAQHYDHLGQSYEGNDAYSDGEHPLFQHHKDHGVPHFNWRTLADVHPQAKAAVASHLSRENQRASSGHWMGWPSVNIEHPNHGSDLDSEALAHYGRGDITVHHDLAHDPDEGGAPDRQWFSPSHAPSTLSHALTHEHGHFLQDRQVNQEDGGARRRAMLHEVSRHIPGASAFHGDDPEDWVHQNREHIINHVGTYAAHDDHELISELYAEHRHSPNPSDAARAAGRHLEGHADDDQAAGRRTAAAAARRAAGEAADPGRGAGDHEGRGAAGAATPMTPASILREAARDADLGFHVIASWADVQRKAKRIRAEGGVTILVASHDGIGGSVRGEHGVYEALLVYRPGTRKVADWTCFLPDAPVTMADGSEKPISEIEVGDLVLSHLGNARQVVRVEPKPYEGGLTTLGFRGDKRAITATSEHEVWTPQGWRAIGELKPGDYVSSATPQGESPVLVTVPRPARRAVPEGKTRGVQLYRREGYEKWQFRASEGGRRGGRRVRYFDTEEQANQYSAEYYAERNSVEIKIDTELASVLGWYAAEGFVRSSGVGYQVGLSLSAEERDVAERIDDIVWRYFGKRGSIRQIDNKLDYRVSDWRLHHLCTHLVGSGAHEKRLHADLMTMPLEEQRAFMAAWLAGDGHVDPSNDRARISSVSETLIRQGRDLLARLGEVPSIGWSDNNRGSLPTTQNAGRIYTLSWVPGSEARRWQRRGGDRIWREVTTTSTEQYSGEVWDIEVEEDHSFRAYGVDVHNCGCKWAAYAFDRSPEFRHFEGRKCSHALALQYEAQSKGMFGKEVHPSEAPGGPTIVRYDPDAGANVYARPFAAALIAQLRTTADDPAEVIGGLIQAGMEHRTAVLLWKGAEHHEEGGERRCPHCGGFIGVEAVEHHHCPHCGAPLGGEGHHHEGAKAEAPPGPKVSGVALKAHDTGRVLMLQRGLDDPDDPAAGTWEFPGGHHEPGDKTSLHAGIREWEEEVGQPFPEGGAVKHTWTSPNGIYQGHVVVIPSEKDVSMKDGRVIPNPDDPKGDSHEQAAWWDVDHAKGNKVLRPEVKANTPWREIAKASLDTAKTGAAWDPISNPNPQPGRGVDEPEHSNATNPVSTGFATSMDPHDWDTATARPQTLIPSLSYDSVLHDEPEPALPSTYGDERPAEMDPEDLDPVPDNPPSANVVPDGDGDLSLLQGAQVMPEFRSTGARSEVESVAEIVATFQRTAAGQALLIEPESDDDIAAAARAALTKEGLHQFDHAEQQELISEGAADGRRARNLHQLKIEGTHYELLQAALDRDEIPDDLFMI